jgi:hypothetical protein
LINIWILAEDMTYFLISSWGCFLKVGSGTTADESTHIQCAERSIQWVCVVASYIGVSGLLRKGFSHRRRQFRHQSDQPVREEKKVSEVWWRMSEWVLTVHSL